MESEPTRMQNRTTVERQSDRELVVTRAFDGPAHLVFEAWTKPELFVRWWVPKSMGMILRSCEMDVRTGGGYRLVFGHDASSSDVFFGRYIEVIPNSRIVWTNDEGESVASSTVIFAEEGGRTLLTFSEVHPSKDALDQSLGGMEATPEQFDQLDVVLASLGSTAA